MATYINNNVKFHAFSKSPVSPDTTLGGAVNPSGHTITTSQVRAQDIPAFLNTFQGTKDQALTWLATNYATPAHNDIVYYGGEFKAGFSTPKCLKYNAKGETPAWEDFDITKATTLKNADDTDVIAVHQDCSTVFVDGGNNAATNSNRWSLFVKKSDGSILDHFVASTDKIVAGMPSLGYNALVLWNGAAIDEGELDANYVGNTFAGIVHLNKQYATGDDAKFKVTCFEYIGDKLNTTIDNLSESVKDIVDVSLGEVVAKINTNTAAENAGISVIDTNDTGVGSKTSPQIAFTAGEVKAGETKLVSGGAVAAVTDALAGRISALEGVKLSVQVVDAVPTTPVINTLYLVPEEGSTTGTYVEYIAYKPEGSDTVTTERIGTTAVDLEGYTTDAEHTALADRVTALDAATTGRVAVVEGKVSTLEGQVETITSTDATKPGSIAKALADANSYTDTAIETELAAGGSIAKAIADYVATNAKVSVNGQSATTITVAGTAEGSADLVKVVVTEDKTITDKIGLTLTATLDAAVLNEDGSIDKDGVVIATIAQEIAETVADTAITNAITTDNGAIKDAIDGAISDATLADGQKIATTTDTSKLVTVEDVTTYVSENAKVTLTQGTGITVTPNGEASTSFTVAVDGTVATKKSVDDLSSLVSGLPATIQAAQDAADDAMVEAKAKVASVTLGTTIPDGISLGTDTKNPVLTIETTASRENKLVTGVGASEIANAYASNAANVIKSQALAQTGSLSGMFTVATAGTVGTGITGITITDTGLAQAIADAKSGAEQTAATALSTARGEITTEIGTAVSGLKTELTTGEGSLGAKVAVLEIATGTTLPAAIEQALDDAKAYSDSLHTTSLDYVVLGDSESLPTASVDTLGKIYLVASQNAPTADGAAISGAYVEYMTRKVGEGETATYTWEKIGTTAADLSGYAKSVKINGQTYNVTANTVDLGSIVTSLSNPTGGDGNGLTVEERGTAFAGEWYVSIAAATDTQMGTSKLFTGSIDATGTATDTAVSVKSASGLYSVLASAIGSKVDNVQAGDGDALTGLSVSVGGTANAPTISVTNGVINSGSLPATAKVVANGLIDGTDVIETEKIAFSESDDVAVIQAFVPADSQLTTWVGDMPNLESGYDMFANCATLTTFIGDLSSLKHGNQMFIGCALTTFIGDLSSLENGDNMFEGCKLSTETALEIVETLPTYTSGTHRITISVTSGSSALLGEIAELAEAKGWSLTLKTDGGTFS